MLRRLLITSVVVGLALLPNLTADARGSRERTPWSIATSINLRYFVQNPASATNFITEEPAHPVLPSPDASQFAIVMRHGDLASDANIYELRVYDTRSVENALRSQTAMPSPLRTLTRRSRSSAGGGISRLTWADHGHILRFSGDWSEDELADHVVGYSYDVDSGELTKTCGEGDNAFDIASSGVVAVCLQARTGLSLGPSEFEHYPSYVVTPAEFLRMFANAAPPHEGDIRTTALERANAPLSVVICEHGVSRDTQLIVAARSGFAMPTWISPDTRHVIALVPVTEVPTSWRGYDATGASSRSATLSRWMLIDTDTGAARSMLDAPDGSATLMGQHQAPQVVWSSDSASVALVNTAMPRGATRVSSTAWVSVYDLSTRRISTVTPIRVDNRTITDVHWTPSNKLLVEWAPSDHTPAANSSSGQARFLQSFVQVRDAWSAEGPAVVAAPQTPAVQLWSQPRDQNAIRSELAQAGQDATSRASPGHHPGSWVDYPLPQPLTFASGLALTVDESADRPQRLIASLGDRRRVLIDADPMLADVAYNRPQVFSWTTPDNQIHRGLLTLPATHDGRPPGLIIQNTQSYTPNVFRPDGQITSAFAQQLLAARGMAVLQVEPGSDIGRTGETIDDWSSHEISRTSSLLDAAIDKLTNERVIDSTRLGIYGFSHTGAIARSMLIAPGRHHFRAAAENDSFNTGLAEYFSLFVDGQAQRQAHMPGFDTAQVHGGPLWANRERWNSEAPDLAAERATGALLVVLHTDFRDSPYESAKYSSYYGAFTAAGRPIDFVSIPHGGHVLIRPRERAASLTTNVDWMDFWVNDHEDPDPAKAEQYVRWREMRTAWRRQQAWEAAGHPAGSPPADDFQPNTPTH